MPSVKELRAQARVEVDAFVAEHGPVALIQQPPSQVFQKVARQMGGGSRTVFMAHRSRLTDRLLAMLQGFEHLQVLFLYPKTDGEELPVGRLDSCAVVVSDPSVSKLHAVLRWNQSVRGCLLRDAGSMNGTYVNSVQLGEEEQLLLDGDGLAFGDAQFLYVSAQTLHSHLNTAAPSVHR